MKLLIASDLHGSAYNCRLLLEAFAREQADRLVHRPFLFPLF